MEAKNIIYKTEFKTMYREGGVAFKVFNEGYSKANVLNEALNQARVEETGLNIPALLDVKKIDGLWAISLEYIEGKTLAEMMDENPNSIDDYMELFVKLQLSIHEKSSPLLTLHKDKMHRKISECGLDATTRYDLHTRLTSMPKHRKVLHGDFNPSNIIITDDGTPFIIDWSHATQGNAGADVARTYLLFKLEGKDELAEKYLNKFCVKSDMAKQYIQKWLPIIAASQLTKGNEHERKLLESWAHVVDYQ